MQNVRPLTSSPKDDIGVKLADMRKTINSIVEHLNKDNKGFKAPPSAWEIDSSPREKTYTQQEVDEIVKKERAKASSEGEGWGSDKHWSSKA